MQLYEYAVWKDEKLDKDGEVVDPGAVLTPPTAILAQNDAHVGMIAARSLSEDDMKDVERITVSIRPFG